MSRRASLLLLALFLPGAVLAQGRSPDANVTYGYAQVLRASPVYMVVRTHTPEQRCDAAPTRDGVAPPGGAGVGHGDRSDGPGASRCRMVEVEHQERRLAGYDVEYQYKGEKYMSRLDSDPGNRLRIRVSVVPDQPQVGSR